MRFFIVDTNEGVVLRTDSKSVANDYAQSEDFFVVDSMSQEWMTPDGREPIKAVGA